MTYRELIEELVCQIPVNQLDSDVTIHICDEDEYFMADGIALHYGGVLDDGHAVIRIKGA